MNVPIINAPIYRARPCAGDRHINLACAKAIKLSRGRVFDCRRYPGAGAAIASREEVKSNVDGHLGDRYGAEEGEPSRCNTTLS
jgi:hypothetical protein